ncbi:MAG: DUF3299 domain-containing protein [Fuerstiella sp.]|nr:DUF3299 domain-containing protein [Fuerstiella sp.]
MTQDLLDQPGPSQVGDTIDSGNCGWGTDSHSADFSYTPISPWGSVATVLGICGLTAFLGLFGIFIAGAAVIVSIAAILRIRGAHGMVRGMLMAALGLVLSLASVSGGIASQIYHYNHEVPEGYKRVNFPEEISARQFRYFENGQRRLHPEVAKLVGQKVFLKGFIWLTQSQKDLEEFVFLKDNGECCFGGEPKPYDMMHVKMQDGKTVDGHNGLVSVAGILRANVAAASGEAVYTVEAQMVEPSRTRF